jgi:GT2 family glycosyltransferase
VVCCAWNEDPALLLRTRASIPKDLEPGLLLLDDASDVPLQDAIFRSSPARMGASKIRNKGASLALAAGAEVLVFVDAHCVLEAGCIQTLANAAMDNPDALVTGDIRPLDDPVNESAHGCGSALKSDMSIDWLPPQTDRYYNNIILPYPVPICPGAMMAVKTGTFHSALQGGFDEGIQMWGYEDVELSLRMWGVGGRVLCDPRAVLRHKFKKGPALNATGAQFFYNKVRVALMHFSPETVMKHVVEGKYGESLMRVALQVLAEDKKGFYDRMRRYHQIREAVHGLTGEQVLQRFGINW